MSHLHKNTLPDGWQDDLELTREIGDAEIISARQHPFDARLLLDQFAHTRKLVF